jgi:hypothetical protein
MGDAKHLDGGCLMGVIFEFYAIPADLAPDPLSGQAHEVDAPLNFLKSFSVNSHSIADLFDALTGTDLAGLIGDGSDVSRGVRVPGAKFARLLAQAAAWADSPSQLLLDAQIAVEDAVEEAEFLQQDLWVVVM